MLSGNYKKTLLQIEEENDNKSLLYSLLNDTKLVTEYCTYFGAFHFQLKRSIEKGRKYLIFNKDTIYTYFRIEQVFSFLCYILYKENILDKYSDTINEYKKLKTISERIDAFKAFLQEIELEELKKNKLSTCYLEYI